jgi:glycogen synthase
MAKKTPQEPSRQPSKTPRRKSATSRRPQKASAPAAPAPAASTAAAVSPAPAAPPVPATPPAAPPTPTPVAPLAPAATPAAPAPETARAPQLTNNPALSQAGPTIPTGPQAQQQAQPTPAPANRSIPLSEEPSRVSDMPQRDFGSSAFAPQAGAVKPPAGLTQAESASLPLLFEIGWEVCWQLGGIYTVLRTKAAAMMKRWGDRYFLIGPYNPQTAAVEFEELPTEGYIRQTLDQLRAQGVPCHYGRWLIPGRPRVILLDYRARFAHMESDKYFMWKDHGITLQSSDGEVNEVVAFGFTVTEFFRNLCQFVKEQPILAQFHEWMGGVAVPRLAHLNLPVTTVFTTHATLLGRYLAADNPHFYQHLPFLDGEREAQHYGIYPRFQIEKAAAHASTVFTTVSEVTAFEAEKLLGRKPEMILPNGLNIQRFAALHEFQNLHRQYKEKIHEFVMSHFFPSYTFDIDNTIYMFTSGRYEYHNKGMDVFIEAMHRLNWRLKSIPDSPTVVAFIITRAPTRSYTVQELQNHSMFQDLRSTCMTIKEQMGDALFMAVARGQIPLPSELLSDDAVVRLKRVMHAYRSGRQPAIVTHTMVDDAKDPVLQHLRHRQLFNAADDRVKMIYHPDFVSATSPLWQIDYEQFVRGCHIGIFPSYYEPWGYTPMESLAMGVPAVATDLSGFGAYVQRHIPNHTEQGILVVNRRTQNFDQSTNDLVDYLYNFVQLSRRQRIELRNRAERLSELFDWSALSRHYHEAHDLALSRRGIHRPGLLEIRTV